jgi:hypothetical protein
MFHLQIFSRLTKAQIAQDVATVILPLFTAKYLALMVSNIRGMRLSSKANKNPAFQISTTLIF